MLDDHFHDECGVFGIFNHSEAANLTYLGLYALQHRGQESAGIVSTDGRNFYSHRAMGKVADAFHKDEIKRLKGSQCIGHVRYSTSGESEIRNCQPFMYEYVHGGISMCHNGNIINSPELRRAMEKKGAIFQSTSDTEVLIHLAVRADGENTEQRMAKAVTSLKGGFALLVLTETRMIGLRDPNGIRPLVLGKLDDSWVLSSETCAFDLIGAEFIRDVEPGELIVIDETGMRSMHPFTHTEPRFCVFEYIYFARPDSTLEGANVYQSRVNIGKELAKENPIDADMIIPVPDSGVPAAMGFSQQSGIPLELGLIRNHYIGRTFIEPKQSIRNFGVKLKLNANRDLIEGKRVILVDDSIVRGTTSRKIVEMVRAAGAAEVHMRISSPPTKHCCHYGINTPTESELMANHLSIEGIADAIGVDSLNYISFDGLYRAIGRPQSTHCDACFSGHYPVEIEQQSPQLSLLTFFGKESH